MKMSEVTIDVGADFSRYPVGRYREDGDANGQTFRDDVLRPLLVGDTHVRIQFDGALGYGSSFLEEVFGGLVRNGFSAEKIKKFIVLVTTDDSLLAEIEGYIKDASAESR